MLPGPLRRARSGLFVPAPEAGGGNTLDPAHISPALTLSNGNLTVAGSGAAYGGVRSVNGATGAFSFSVHIDNVGATDLLSIGLVNASHTFPNGGDSWIGEATNNSGSGVYNSGSLYVTGVPNGSDPDRAFVTGDTVHIVGDGAGHFTIQVNSGPVMGPENLPTGAVYAFIGCDDASAIATVDLTGFP